MPVPMSHCYDATGVLSVMQTAECRHWRFWRGKRLCNEIRLVSTAAAQYVSWLVVAGKPAVELMQAEKRVLRLLARVQLLAHAALLAVPESPALARRFPLDFLPACDPPPSCESLRFP